MSEQLLRTEWERAYDQGRQDERRDAQLGARYAENVEHAYKNQHDPLCPFHTGGPCGACHCNLIARVREDEQGKCAHECDLVRYDAYSGLDHLTGDYVLYSDHCAEVDRLRQQDAGEFLTPIALTATGPSDPRYAKGYAAALRDAVEALKSLSSDMANWNSAETTAATNVCPDLTFDQWTWCQRGVHRAVAAIEALGGER